MFEPTLTLGRLFRQEKLLLFRLLQALHQKPTLDLDPQSLSAFSPLESPALDRFLEKARGFSLSVKEKQSQRHFPIFSALHLDMAGPSLSVVLNPACFDLLRSMPYCLFDLQELQGLSRDYSKALYRLLQHSKHMHMVRFEWEDFKRRMGIPKDYKSNYICKQILRPVILECNRYTVSLRQLSMAKHIKDRHLHFVDFKFNTRSPVLHKRDTLNYLGKRLSAQLKCDRSLSFELANPRPKSPARERHHLIKLHDHSCGILATFYNQTTRQEWGMHFKNLDGLLHYMQTSQVNP